MVLKNNSRNPFGIQHPMPIYIVLNKLLDFVCDIDYLLLNDH